MVMKKILMFALIIILNQEIVCSQQITIPRIEKMSNMPSSYAMRDWKQVTVDYDNFVFDVSKSGTYLPLTSISNASGVNYPNINHIMMDTYVGQNNHGNVAEAINIIPAVVGASLVGIDKTNDLNTNWVEKIKDFYNLTNGQKVYLNDYSAKTGNDWWYEVMPNVFFYQLLSLYPNLDNDFKNQFTTVADVELSVLKKLGGSVQPWNAPNMYYRAFNLSTGLPNSTSVAEPETAGSIAWLMYQAYVERQDPKYLEGAEMALDYLNSLSNNPSYEIQLPYGISVASRMNAIEGTNYDIEKMLNWTFSSGANTLRGWGTIVGSWNGYDMSGLIGEANDSGNDYAFSMNGFQHAAALAPVAKYDKRFARAIGKWMLNLSNASRYFYNNGLPSSNQESSSYAWSNQYDTNSCIPYEAIKQTWNGVSPEAMGDAVKGSWASTDLSLYSGSSVGYLASVVSTTNISGILQIDLNKTDFRGNNIYSTYLYYNPYSASQNLTLALPSGNYDVYDAISESFILSNASGNISFNIDADSVKLLVIIPAGSVISTAGRFKLANGNIIDYHFGYSYINSLRVKSFSVSDSIVQKASPLDLYCLVENNTSTNLTYDWYQDGTKIASTSVNTYTWTSPSTAGYYNLSCKVTDNGTTVASYAKKVNVIDELNIAPQINDVTFDSDMPFQTGSSLSPKATINTPNVQYSWSAVSGIILNAQTKNPVWTIPTTEGIYSITLIASNAYGADTLTKQVLTKDCTITTQPTPVIYYPFNGNTKNYAQSNYNAVAVNSSLTTGANGVSNDAYQFPTNTSYIYTANDNALNFTDKIAVSLWMKPDYFPGYEQLLISHGSWEERYKISITPEKKVRWTVKTTNSIVDVDDDTISEVGKFAYYTAIYTGYSLELYRNGKLANFKPLTGNMGTTTKSLTIAHKDVSTNDYNFRGTIDEVRIYDSDLPKNVIKSLPGTFSLLAGTTDVSSESIKIYPNPCSDKINISINTDEEIVKTSILDLTGKIVLDNSSGSKIVDMANLINGVYLLEIRTNRNDYKFKILKN